MMAQRQQCNFFLLRYVPDLVKNEFINIGVVLLPPAGPAEVRFTHDWSRVRSLDPDADLEWIKAVEAELRNQLLQMNGERDFIIARIQDSFSNALQPSEFKACLAESPAAEADELARLYLERPSRRSVRDVSARQMIRKRMEREFEIVGAWPLMAKNVAAENYTRKGDPLEIDCGYSPNGVVKLFHALAVRSDPNSAKVLAFTFPYLVEGIRKRESKQTELTAVVEDDLSRDEGTVSFALETLQQQHIKVARLAEMPVIAAAAARELGIG